MLFLLFCFVFLFVCFLSQCTEAVPIVLTHSQKKEDKRRNNKEKKPEGKGGGNGWERKKETNGGNRAQKSYQWLVF